MIDDGMENRHHNATTPTANKWWLEVDGQVFDVKA